MTRRASAKDSEPQQRCAVCQRSVNDLPTVETGTVESGPRTVCLRCSNEAIAANRGLEFQHVDFPPLDLVDAEGRTRNFEFALRLLRDRLALDAQELVSGERTGIRLQVLRRPTEDPFEMQAALVAGCGDALRSGVSSSARMAASKGATASCNQ